MSCCQKKNKGCGLQSGQVEAVSDYLVCTCMGVMYQDICEAIKNGQDTYESLSEALGVGTGCSSCVAEVQAILKSNFQSGCCKS